jgi:hypothetical protein
MRRGKVVAGFVACTVAGVFACWLYQSCLLVGWLRGEAFYLGRPTSYWGRELAYWDEPSLAISWVPSRRTVYRNEIALAVDLKAPAVATLNGWMVHLPYLIVPVDDPNHPARARADVSDTVWVDTSFYSRKPGLVDKLVGYFGVMFDNPDRSPARPHRRPGRRAGAPRAARRPVGRRAGPRAGRPPAHPARAQLSDHAPMTPFSVRAAGPNATRPPRDVAPPHRVK